MKDTLKSFAHDFGLTPRETEVLQLLAHEVVGLKNIAERLGLSPHTVNNHFKSIFEKTKSNSRTQLLASFLKYTVNKLQSCKHLHKRPRILIVDDEPSLCESLSKALTRRGTKVYAYSDPAKVIEALPNLKLDVIISDIQMPGLNGVQLLEGIRKHHRYSPAVIFISGFSGIHSECDLMDRGAAALVEKPVNLDKLFYLIMEQFIEDQHEKVKYLKINERIPILFERKFRLNTGNIGYGGAFIPIDFERAEAGLPAFKVGDIVSFEFGLENSDRLIEAKAEVVWKRARAQNNLEPGIGVKFVDLAEADRDSLQEYVQLKSILSFVPNGLRAG
jgi:DNA-binding NarL/FixJ family response regulator